MSLIGNLLWFIFGGIFIFFGYMVGGIALCFTIIGIPWGFQCFKLAIFALFPFGSETRVIDNDSSDINLLLNIIWLIFGGLWIAINHLVWGLILSISIIGLPFGLQHLKMVKLAFTPFGRVIYDIDDY
jgi:uncharacterized membrane protein YccF (DUF307 family)